MLLLITGCINVNKNIPLVKVYDLKSRLNDYINTINWAIETKIFTDIIFCENSNYQLEISKIFCKAKNYGKSFEYLTFSGNIQNIVQQGKGYGEGEIIDFALNNSRLLKKYKFFCKITGRLKISNIDSLINQQSNWFMNKKELKETDTRFYCIKKDDYNTFLRNSYLNVDDTHGFFLEHAFYQELHKGKIRYKMFLERPLFQGVSGSTGRIYQDSKTSHEWIYDILCRTNLYNNRQFWNIVNDIKNIKKGQK